MANLMNAAQRLLAKQGRFGDTELVHVNKKEKDLLIKLGGANTRNPMTGLKEFYEEGESARSDAADRADRDAAIADAIGAGVGPGSIGAGYGNGPANNQAGVGGIGAGSIGAGYGGTRSDTGGSVGMGGAIGGGGWGDTERADAASAAGMTSDGLGSSGEGGGSEVSASTGVGDIVGSAGSNVVGSPFSMDPSPLYEQSPGLVAAQPYSDMLSPTSLMAAGPAPTAGMSAIAAASAPIDSTLQPGAAVAAPTKEEETPASRSFLDSVIDKGKSIRDQIMESFDKRVGELRAGPNSETIDFGRVPGKVEQAVAATPNPINLGKSERGPGAPEDTTQRGWNNVQAAAPGPTTEDMAAAALAAAKAPAGPVYADVPTPSPRPSDEEIYGSQAPAAASSTARGPVGRSAPAASSAVPGPAPSNRQVDPLTRQEYTTNPTGQLIGNSADDDLLTGTVTPSGFPAHVPTPAARSDLEKGIGINMHQRDERTVNSVLPDAWSKDMGTTPQTYFDPGSNGFRSATTGDRVMDPSYAATAAGWAANAIPGVGLANMVSGLLGGPTVQGVLANAQPGAPDFAAQTYGSGDGNEAMNARNAQAALMASTGAGAGAPAPGSVAAAAAAANPFKNAIHDPLHALWHTVPNR